MLEDSFYGFDCECLVRHPTASRSAVDTLNLPIKRLSHFSGNPAVRKVQVSPQLNLAVFQYLTTQVDPFKPDHLEEMVLKKLLSLDIYREIKYKSRGKVRQKKRAVKRNMTLTRIC